ncbi:MAG: ribonuclease III [Dehalococcoidia bacterium]|nr:ribonuclease III [Dehalococcoidia bacterium]
MKLPDLEAAQARFGIVFRDPTVLLEALVHRSYNNEYPHAALPDNERLEFLGDAALGLVVARWLYDRFPLGREGQLTEIRAALVKRDTLARVASDLEIGDYLLLGKGEEASGGRTREQNLARAFEALVGAVLVDKGFSVAARFIKRSLKPELTLLGEEPVTIDVKSRLQQIVQARWQRPPSYKTVGAEGPDHAKVFTVEVHMGREVLGVGRGRSKQLAEKEAALHAVETLIGHPEAGSSSESRTD